MKKFKVQLKLVSQYKIGNDKKKFHLSVKLVASGSYID